MTDQKTTSGPGMARQLEIYQLSLSGKRLSIPVPLAHLEAKARAILSAQAYDYVAGGAGGERTMAANLEAFSRWQIVPRMLRDVSQRDLGVEILGTPLPAPVLLGPVGVQEIIHPEAEVAVARAAAAMGVPFVLSTLSSRSLEEVARAASNAVLWFQLYWPNDRGLAASLVQRAEKAGYRALVVTLDTFMLGWRERDLQHPFLPFLLGKGLANYFSDPVFRSRLAQPPGADPAAAIGLWGSVFSDASLTWRDLEWLRRQTRLPILLKGILHRDDAAHALDCGMDGIIVSNHGGRQVDGAIPSLDALAEIVRVVQKKVPVLFDSGIRRGSDAFKALALGADAVLLARLYLYGLAVAGEAGVRDVVLNFLADFDLTLALSGYKNCRELDISALRPAAE